MPKCEGDRKGEREEIFRTPSPSLDQGFNSPAYEAFARGEGLVAPVGMVLVMEQTSPNSPRRDVKRIMR